MGEREVENDVRIEELLLLTPAGPIGLHFDERVTVIGPVGADDRRALIDAVLSAATGTTDEARLRYRDDRGRLVLTGRDGAVHLEDRRPAPSLLEVGGALTGADLESLMVVGAAHLGLPDTPPTAPELEALAAARAVRDRLARRLAATRQTLDDSERIGAELTVLDLMPAVEGPVDDGAVGNLLARRRRELQARLTDARTTDVDGLDRDLAQAARLVATLETRVGDPAGAPSSAEVTRRLIDRAGRGSTRERTLPLLLDDPLAFAPTDRRAALLDVLLRISHQVQIVYLTEDPGVLGWSRAQPAGHGVAVLQPA